MSHSLHCIVMAVLLAFSAHLHAMCPPDRVINKYTPALSLDPCRNRLTVEDAHDFHAGDTVLLIQMKGAVIDRSDTPGFGQVSDHGNAGNYAFNYVRSVNGNEILLLNTVTRTFNFGAGKVQLIRVPYYRNFETDDVITAAPWDGSTGGVLAFNVEQTLTLNHDLDVSGKGYAGGRPLMNRALTCHYTGWASNQSENLGGQKGEGIHVLEQELNYGRGGASVGGGGGNAHNAGGGGGANGGAGGRGGRQWEGAECPNPIVEGVNGRPGNPLPAAQVQRKLFLGGGGGMGHGNDGREYPAGDGGGITIFSAARLVNYGSVIRSNGTTAITCSGISDCTDGMSGGGAGGTVLMDVPVFVNSTTIEAAGGNGANSSYLNAINPNQKTGPGGGGGGGWVLISQAGFAGPLTTVFPGGINGISVNHANDAFEAQPGETGRRASGIAFYKDETVFLDPIDSVRIDSTLITCRNYGFNGIAFLHNDVIDQWQWDFGEGSSASTQQTVFQFDAGGAYQVSLTATTAQGCIARDTILLNVPRDPQIRLTADTAICNGSSLQLHVTGGASYQWSPGATLTDTRIPDPIASPRSSTVYFVDVTDSYGCTYRDSVSVEFRRPAIFRVNADKAVCLGDTAQLSASGGDRYTWTPATGLSNPGVPNPVANVSASTSYEVRITESVCGESAMLSTTVQVDPLPTVELIKANDLDCSTASARLSAVGTAVNYRWSPSVGLNSVTGSSVTASPRVTTQYVVEALSTRGCSAYDSVQVYVTKANEGGYLMPDIFTPNHDGVNDCFGVGLWGLIDHLDFSIYDRWGQRIYHTNDPAGCWDGRYKGVLQPLGVYVFVIRASTNCSPGVFRKGTFTLAR